MPLRVNGQEQRHFFPDHIDKIYAQIRSKGYPVDWDRLHCTGYSAGGRGCVRQAVERPHVSVTPMLFYYGTNKANMTDVNLLSSY